MNILFSNNLHKTNICRIYSRINYCVHPYYYSCNSCEVIASSFNEPHEFGVGTCDAEYGKGSNAASGRWGSLSCQSWWRSVKNCITMYHNIYLNKKNCGETKYVQLVLSYNILYIKCSLTHILYTRKFLLLPDINKILRIIYIYIYIINIYYKKNYFRMCMIRLFKRRKIRRTFFYCLCILLIFISLLLSSYFISSCFISSLLLFLK